MDKIYPKSYTGLMDILQSPLNDPLWQALAREAEFSVQLICAGANDISRADFTNQSRYTTAQFGLSNGIERLGKQILMADNLIEHSKPLTDRELRDKGHSISEILDEVQQVQVRRDIRLTYERPADQIATNVVDCLNIFADARRGRYANFKSMQGNQSPDDSVKYWWSRVCEPILEKHFRNTRLEKYANENPCTVGQMINSISETTLFHENGSIVTVASDAAFMAYERKATQRWGRYYSLSQARWMGELFTELTRDLGYTPGFEFFFGHYEYLQTLLVTNQYLLKRKTWPLK